jgi:hypothetical protein
VDSSSKIDLTNNDMIVDYTSTSPFADIKADIISAYGSGSFTWGGNGITSGNAAGQAESSHITALGYAEASAVFGSFPATFVGETVDNTTVLVRYVYAGDVDLSGGVDSIDFNILASNFSETGQVWSDGDMNYDGTVDTIDSNLLTSNYTYGDPTAAPALGAVVPEPATMLSGAMAGVFLARRRRLENR